VFYGILRLKWEGIAFMPILRTRVDRHGRIVIPAEIRRMLGVEAGDEVVLDAGPHDVRLSSHSAALTSLKQMVREAGAGKPYSTREFLEERRKGAADEGRIWQRRRKAK
jgi:AbrB family looped-hinge helix DNA binding protein